MQSSLHMKCPKCNSVYVLSTDELNIAVLFQCTACGEYNTYIAGHVLALDREIMSRGLQDERRKHIIEVLQLWACEFAGNVLRNVDRVVDVNLDMDLQSSDTSETMLEIQESESKKALPTPRMPPSITWSDAPAITDEEIRDFLSIDLNLIDKKSYFDKVFGTELP